MFRRFKLGGGPRRAFGGFGRGLALVCALAAAGAAQSATTVFSDDFNDGDVSDWTLTFASAPIAGTAGLAARAFQGGTVFEPFFLAPPGGSALRVQGSRSFIAPVTGSYTLALLANSYECSGCTMSFEVLVNGATIASVAAPSNTALSAYSYSLNLAAGSNTLTLGMFTTGASSGRFGARFDDVVISTDAALVPLPASGLAAMAGIGALAALRRRRFQPDIPAT
ncbi:hypothetical protein DKT77_00260 [Meridianimarinicoccus roseus]|uniref:PEP-CTERM sorting domain-containing protein n=1 Tax=Meridianimarinicoccus roseus TaxID=2072018 RepID=A0A2V2LN85_9RHOB|nr:VPLPA-CTERM sorting domain-containing protein [Meridianimarinicoccus roseus]PWR04676.1 hypothetical protein DKT77_00260 [Meridianimarinicoccus roseus]